MQKSKAYLYFWMYGEHANTAAVLHPHSSQTTAVSILEEVDSNDVFALTPEQVVDLRYRFKLS